MMSNTIYGVVATGTITEEQISTVKAQGRILWRQSEGVVEVWNYTTEQWESTDDTSLKLEDMIRMAEVQKS